MASEDTGWKELDVLEALYLNRLDLLKDEHRRKILSQYEYELANAGQRNSSNPIPGCPSTSSAPTAMSSAGPGNGKVRRKISVSQLIDEIIDRADLVIQRAEALRKEWRKLMEEICR